MQDPNPATSALTVRGLGFHSIALLALFGLILAARAFYVSIYAEDLPYWDQWDAEADRLLRPWMEGNWHLANLFEPHAEHRIALTRLISLALFTANDHQWDNLVEAYANTMLYAAVYALLYWLLSRDNLDRRSLWANLLAVLTISVLPFSWENVVVGFQSQFYCMALGALALVALVIYRRLSRTNLAFLCMLGVMSLFTMAAGMLGCVAAAGAMLLRCARDMRTPRIALAVVACMAIVTALGLLLIPAVPSHVALKSIGIKEHMGSMLNALMWPLESYGGRNWSLLRRWLCVLVLWAPSLLWLIRFARFRRATDGELFAAGMMLWVALQAVAIAHSRGHGMVALSSRYMDLTAMGLILNAWFATRLVWPPASSSVPRGGLGKAIAIGFALVAIVGLYRRTGADLQAVRERHHLTVVEMGHVRDYVRTGDPTQLVQPFQHIPYPDADRLRSLLDNPTIHDMLPASVRASLALEPAAELQGLTESGRPPDWAPVNGRPVMGPFIVSDQISVADRRYVGPTLHARFPYLQFWITRRPVNGNLDVWLARDAKPSLEEHTWQLARATSPAWRRIYTRVPEQRFQLTVRGGSDIDRFAFTAPVELGRLSLYAHWLQDQVRRLVYGQAQPGP